MRFNYTLDSPSPVLRYSGSWTPVGPEDPDLSQYRNRTAMKTSTVGDTVQFSFNGTGVWVYGAKRPNHGNYNVILDTDTFELNGNAPAGQDVFQIPLFSSGNLSSGPHEITITNHGPNGASDFFDIDFVTWESSLPDGSTSKTFTSRDKQFEYLPGPNWWSWGNDPKSYDGILYYTQSSSAAFRFNFTGQSIALYGYLDTNHGNFSCSIDGVGRGIYTGYYPSKEYQQLICFGDNLDHGDHVLHVTNLPVSTDDAWFSIDYAEVWGTNPGRARGRKSSSTNAGAIAGGVVGGLVFLAVLAGLAAFFLRRRRDTSKRAGHRGSRPIQHRDVFEIDGRPGPVPGDGDNLHSHVTPYDPYGDSASTAAEQSTQVLGSNHHTTFTGGDTRSSIGPNDSQSQSGSRQRRTYSSNPRYLTPQPEQDAGPLVPLNESDDEDENRAVAGPSLPPVYSSIVGALPEQTAVRDEKLVSKGGLRVVGPHAHEIS